MLMPGLESRWMKPRTSGPSRHELMNVRSCPDDEPEGRLDAVRPRAAEVGHLEHLVLPEAASQDVVRLDFAVDVARLVRRREAGAHEPERARRAVGIERLAGVADRVRDALG